eukprot:CAMPEP_0178373060 /NCGR_PEP_ID=MMETSP0689_2-20121128/1671_1 /TAXON_ID=160604 /ORGANISM="Amphidinium massartii, Strain CS-259" /LENGTH=196 /DNA_ID=CAMNT_0019992997 /DNA_START=24 /DNA_END=611 /DNA_ORIENTATION=-
MSAEETDRIASLRRDYGTQGIEDADVCDDPIAFFSRWFDEALAAHALEPNAMCLSTVDKESGRPSARYVLLKGFDASGFTFYCNYGSKKAQHLEGHPFACLTFWWGELERQVRIEGRVAKIAPEESEAYFRSRPKGSQIGALASDQSQPIASRAALDEKVARLREEYGGAGAAEVPMPSWGGFRVEPDLIEFWKGR